MPPSGSRRDAAPAATWPTPRRRSARRRRADRRRGPCARTARPSSCRRPSTRAGRSRSRRRSRRRGRAPRSGSRRRARRGVRHRSRRLRRPEVAADGATRTALAANESAFARNTARASTAPRRTPAMTGPVSVPTARPATIRPFAHGSDASSTRRATAARRGREERRLADGADQGEQDERRHVVDRGHRERRRQRGEVRADHQAPAVEAIGGEPGERRDEPRDAERREDRGRDPAGRARPRVDDVQQRRVGGDAAGRRRRP